MTDRSALRKMKIAVVDDHELVREGLKAVLSKHGINDVEKFGTATELVAAMEGGNNFDFYIIDLELPDIDGFVLIEMIRARNASARIIVSTVHDEIWTLRKLLARDVNAVIYKSVDGIEVIDAMVDILAGKNYYCKGVRNALKEAADQSLHPTDRELEVLYQISQGKTSREIAAAMFVTDNTIEAHRKALFSKLGAINVADLIVKAIERGYLTKNGGKSNLA